MKPIGEIGVSNIDGTQESLNPKVLKNLKKINSVYLKYILKLLYLHVNEQN